MRVLFAGLLLSSLTACATNAAEAKTHEQITRELNVLAAKCSPAGNVQFDLIGPTHLRIRPSSSAKFEEVDCFMAGIRPYHFDLGLVGNEAYETPVYSLEMTANDRQGLHVALEGYAAGHGFSLAYRDPPLVPPHSRSYELLTGDARIRVFNPFKADVFLVTIFATEKRAREVCQTLLTALVSQGFEPRPAADFTNPPPFCPSA